MSEKLNRLKKLQGTEVAVDYKHVKLDGMAEILQEMKNAQASNEAIKKELALAIKELGVLMLTGKSEMDTGDIIKAIKSLEIKTIVPERPAFDYTINFDRDSNGLMKSGITLKSSNKTTKH